MNERFRIRLEKEGRLSREELWSSDQPHGLGRPLRWILERTPEGVRIRGLGIAGSGPQSAMTREFTNAELDRGVAHALPDDQGTLRVQKVRELRSPALQNFDDARKVMDHGAPLVRAYAGCSGSLINSTHVAAAYVGYTRNRPIIAIYRDGRTFRARALLPGLSIKFKGEAPTSMPVEQEVTLKEEQLARATFVRGRYWWKFTYLEQSGAAEELPEVKAAPVSFMDWGIRLAIFLTIAALIWALFNAPAVPKPEEKMIKKQKALTIVRVAPREGSPAPAPMNPIQVAEPAAAANAADAKKTTEKANAESAPAPKAAQPAPAKAVTKPAVQQATSPAKATQTPTPQAAAAKAEAAAQAAAKQAAAAAAKQAARADAEAKRIAIASSKAEAKAKADAAAAQAKAQAAAAKAAAIAAAAAAKAQAEAQSIQSALGNFMKTSGEAGVPAAGLPANGAAGPRVDQVQGFGEAGIKTQQISGGGVAIARAGGGAKGGSATGYGSGNAGTVLGTQGGRGVALGTEGLPNEVGLTRDEVGAVIHSHMSEVRYCYESALLARPNLEGKLVVAFTISPQGIVSKSGVQSSTTNEGAVDECVVRKLKTWKFPKPRGGISVPISYPFLLKQLRRE